jgi:hypothetical protein
MAEVLHSGGRAPKMRQKSKRLGMTRLRHDSFMAATDAQVFVILAVLLITIAVTATGAYLAIKVPVETEKSEFQHANEVASDFTTLDTTVQALTWAKSADASASVPIQLTPKKMSPIAIPPSSGALSFASQEGSITVRLNDGGTPYAGSPWTDDEFVNTTHSNVDTSSGDVTLAGPPYQSGYIESNMSVPEGQLGKDTGSNCTVYGNLSWYTSIHPNTELSVKVRTDMFPDMRHAKAWKECPEIGSLEGHNEIPLSAVSAVSHGHRYIQWRAELRTWDPAETPVLANLSINFSSSEAGVILAHSSGSITYMSNYHYLPNHVLTYENGAVVKTQAVGGFMARPPGINFTNSSSGMPRVNISMVNLISTTGKPYSGAPSISVRLFRSEYALISDSLYFPNITLNLTTDFTDVWSNWFNQSLEKSGINKSHYMVVPNSTARTVEVTVSGDGGVVELYLEKTDVLVNLQA